MARKRKLLAQIAIVSIEESTADKFRLHLLLILYLSARSAVPSIERSRLGKSSGHHPTSINVVVTYRKVQDRRLSQLKRLSGSMDGKFQVF
jgi:hypothetical protein